MHKTISTFSKTEVGLSNDVISLYTEQLDTTSPWFILNPITNQILLHSNNFNELFDCKCDSHDLSLNNLPITQASYDHLIAEISATVKSEQLDYSLIALEMQCSKIIPLWLSLQTIDLGNKQLGIVVYTQPLDAPKYIIYLLQNQLHLNINSTTPPTSDSGIRHATCSNHSSKFATTQHIILNLVLAGFSQREIGEKLNLSRTRIAQHITLICREHGLTNGSSKLLKQQINLIRHST